MMPADAHALRAIAEGVEAETGERFFASLVQHLAAALAVQYAFVSELSADGHLFRTRAVWGRGRFLANIEVPVAGTPCESVLRGEMAHHPDRLQELFPQDVGLAEWGVHSYAGVPLLDRDGTVVGHLAIFDDQPMRDARGVDVMRIFAARARAEIERLRMEAALRDSEQRFSRILASAMDAIVTIDAERRIVLFNAAAEAVFACAAADACGKPIDPFLTDGLRRELDRSLASLGRDAPTQPYVWAPDGVSARGADGREFPIEATISRADAGGTALFTLILRDVDARRRAEDELRQLHRENAYLQEEIRQVHNVEDIVGTSAALAASLEQVRLVAPTDSTVLVLGETGTGKELIARALHSGSPRRDRPLIKVNCAALPAGLIESELFGHERGAFTGATERRVGRFELADGGTIFLDEVGELPLDVQAKLLRVLQEQEFERIGGTRTIHVDVRVIAATNRELAQAVGTGAFRSDLFYRLNVFPIALPPLRQRLDDIPLLVHYFTARYAAKIGRRIERVPHEVMRRLAAYPWPGNVRELENVIERAVILSPGPELQVGSEFLGLPAPIAPVPPSPAPTRTPSPDGAVPAAPPPGIPAPRADTPRSGTLRDVERSHILDVLRSTGWRVEGPQGAARILQMHPNTLRSRMQRLGIRRGDT